MLQEVAPGKERKLSNAFLRAAGADIQRSLGGADTDIGLLENAQIELLLVAEIVVKHPLVGAGPLGDGIDTCSPHAVFGKFPRSGFQNGRAGALRIALG